MVPAPAGASRRGPPLREDALFTRGLRFEWADEEGRPLLVSYGIAFALAVLWLLLVAFMPPSEPAISLLSATEAAPVQITFEDPAPPEPLVARAAARPAAPVASPDPEAAAAADARRRQQEMAAISGAFGAPAQGRSGMVGDVSNVLRGVDVAPRAPSSGGAPQGKAVIAYGAGGQGSRTPGRDGLGAEASAANIGGVSAGEGVARASVRVAAPTVVRAEAVNSVSRDVGDLGNYVRGRQSQIRFCYEEYGLKANPSLAGTVTIAITLTGSGSVTATEITGRTWSGAGVSETEACLRSRIAAWRFPASEHGGGTYSFPFNFTR